jgi:addiction module HigA family antidote
MGDSRKLDKVHPGEVLKKDYMEPSGLSVRLLAERLGVPQVRVYHLVAGRRSVTPEMAVKLAAYFKTTALYWMHMQAAFDLEEYEDKHAVQ